MGTIRLSQRDLSKHLGIFGDSGAGKTQIVTQLLIQIEDRDETAIIYDPDHVYRKRFFNKKRGDISFDPSLDDCCFWDFGNEPADMGEAKMLAYCLFPDLPNAHDNFFQPACREVEAWLHYHKRPTTAQMCDWMAHNEKIDRMVKGTALETILSENSPGQRAGVHSHLNLAAQSLGMMPASPKGRTRFSGREYVEHRRGWIFISGKAMHSVSMKPIHQMVIGSLAQRYIAAGKRKDLRRTYFVVGEASAMHVHELHTVLVRARQTDTPVVYEIQSMSDLEVMHGKHAKAIFSNAYSKCIGRTSHPDLAQELRDTIGQCEYERLIESWSYNDRGRPTKSIRIDRVKEFPYTKEDIINFDDLEGVFIQPKVLVPYKLPIVDLSLREEVLVERVIPDSDFVIDGQTPPPAETPWEEPLPPEPPPNGNKPSRRRAPGIPKGRRKGTEKGKVQEITGAIPQ